MKKTRLGCTILEGNDVADLPLVSQNAGILDTEIDRVDKKIGSTNTITLTAIEEVDTKVDKLIADNKKEHGNLLNLRTTEKSNIVGSINELFQNVSNGKQVIATAITDKGVITSGSDKFSKMATNINAIETDKTGDATAQADDILAPKTAYVKGNKVVGTIASKGAQTYTPEANPVSIESGQYLSGAQTIAGIAVPVSDVLVGTTIAGQEGTMPNQGNLTETISIQSGMIRIIPGYYTGGIIKAEFSNLYGSTIKNGVTVGGVRGTFKGSARVVKDEKNLPAISMGLEEYTDIKLVDRELNKSVVVALSAGSSLYTNMTTLTPGSYAYLEGKGASDQVENPKADTIVKVEYTTSGWIRGYSRSVYSNTTNRIFVSCAEYV